MKRFSNDNNLYFVTITIIDWIDIFTRNEYKEWISEQIIFCQKNKNLELYAYVIMTNHIHMVARVKEMQTMSELLRDFKTFTSKELYKLILNNPSESRKEWLISAFNKAGKHNANNENFQIWQNGSFPTLLDSNFLIDQKVDYIHQNPVKAGSVDEASKYLYSSANVKSPIKVLEI